MTYGIITRVVAPGEAYDAIHQAVLAHAAQVGLDGLLVHIGRVTDDGFEVIEVWESKEQLEAATAAIVEPAMADAFGGGLPPGPPPVTETFQVRGIVIPAGNVFS